MGAENTWIDLSDEAVEANWVDSEGQTTSYKPWASGGSPNGGTGQNCAYQLPYKNGLEGGKWDDAACNDVGQGCMCVLCEKPTTTTITTAPGI